MSYSISDDCFGRFYDKTGFGPVTLVDLLESKQYPELSVIINKLHKVKCTPDYLKKITLNSLLVQRLKLNKELVYGG